MKQLSILCLTLLLVWSVSCTTKDTNEATEAVTEIATGLDSIKIKKIFSHFQLYTSSGEIGNDVFGNILKPFAKEIMPLEAKSFFDYRYSIQNGYGKIEFSNPIDSISIVKLFNLSGRNPDGGIIFNVKKSDKLLKMETIGIKKYNKVIEVDNGTNPVIDDNYKNYVIQSIKDKKTVYDSTLKYPYIYFDKTLTNVLMSAMKKIYLNEPNKKIYFYYGYSKGEKYNIYHPSLLFSIYSDLESKSVDSSNQTKYAFANRGTICCPPPPQY